MGQKEHSFLGVVYYSDDGQPEPQVSKSVAYSSSTTRSVVRFGLFTLLICPAVMLVGAVLWPLMPSCRGGSNAITGCILFGVNLNWLYDLFILAFLGAFFLVPLGILILVVGAVFYIRDLPDKSPK